MNDQIVRLGQKITHISNQFENGEFNDFRAAIKALIEAYRLEIIISRSMEIDDDVEFWEQQIKEAESALQIYNNIITKAENRALAHLRKAALNQYADALESGNYTSFAF
jgi:hypothetical protein